MIARTISAGAFLYSVLLAVPLFAQTSGSFTGTVADETGAAVVGAEVRVGNPSTGVRRKTSSNTDGNYLIAGLDAGAYDITIAAPGFSTFQAKRVILRVGEKIRVDTKLQIGEVTSKIVVEGSSVGKVETQSSELAGTITGSSGSNDCVNGNADAGEAPTNFLHPQGVHMPRIGEFGLKFIF